MEIIPQMRKRDGADYLCAAISTLLKVSTNALSFPWQPNVQLHVAWSFSLFMISERATFLRAF